MLFPVPTVTDRADDDLPLGSIPELTPDDDRFHPATDHWWETETAWFAFSIPERRIGDWFYNQVLATQQVCNGGAWVWDDSPGDALYSSNQKGLALPPIDELDLRVGPPPNVARPDHALAPPHRAAGHRRARPRAAGRRRARVASRRRSGLRRDRPVPLGVARPHRLGRGPAYAPQDILEALDNRALRI